MYNPLLDTFINVVDCGSFSKASEKLYMSPTAIMKQMNSLEDHLKIKLIERKTTGVKLTPAGEKIYNDAKFIINYSKNSVKEAQKIAGQNSNSIKVGTSMLNPAKTFMDLWYKYNDGFSDIKLKLVPFDDEHSSILNEINEIGKKYDFIAGICDSKSWLKNNNFFQLYRVRKEIAVSFQNPLAKNDELKLSDLSGQTLLMVKKGDSKLNDNIHEFLEKKYPDIKIETTDYFYDMSVFNECAETNKMLLITSVWENIRPDLKPIKLDWDFSIPYGLIYSKNPSENVKRFINVIKSELTDREKII
jgi:DNA-binding transcriptional LysR family regulator